ncbi:MAG: hypothetical protein HYV07_00255 [Deltaproteobacteria bacterium]|nr:hypothetical protein [Deltaproteobacteria bacterium]
MGNLELAEIFAEMAELMELKGGEDRYRIRAFRRIARVLEHLPRSARTMLEDGGLVRIPGIGRGGVERIKEILRTGTCAEHARLLAALPPGLRKLAEVKGLGKKTVRLAYAHLRVSNLEELEWAARQGKLSTVPGLPAGIDHRALVAIEEHRQRAGRQPLADALALGEQFARALAGAPGVERAILAGSARRRKPSVGDLDVLVAADEAAPILDALTGRSDVKRVLRKGDNRASVLLETGRQLDVVVRPPSSFGAALHYFTGSQQHNIYLRARGNRLQLKISDKGIFRRSDESLINSAATEALVFAAVGLPFIPPELRENTGELEAAAAGRLPELVEEAHLEGELVERSDRELLLGLARLGRRWAIVFRAPDAPRQPNSELGLATLDGLEVEVDAAGAPLVPAEQAASADIVRARIRPNPDADPRATTQRAVRAIESGLVDILGFELLPTSTKRAPVDVDLERVLDAARRQGVAIELGATRDQLSIDSPSVRRASAMGIPVAPALVRAQLDDLRGYRFDLFVARRGWLCARDVLTTYSIDQLRGWRQGRLARAGTGLATTARPAGGVEPSGASIDEPSPPAENLSSALDLRPLPAAVRARLQAFMEEGADLPLERELEKRGPNPVQVAFELLLASAEDGR